MAHYRHRRHRPQQLHSRQILIFFIVFHREPRPLTFSLVLSISSLHPSWRSFVCKKRVSSATWQKFLFPSALYSSFSVQRAHPVWIITRLVVPSQLWWLMTSVFVFLHVVLYTCNGLPTWEAWKSLGTLTWSEKIRGKWKKSQKISYCRVLPYVMCWHIVIIRNNGFVQLKMQQRMCHSWHYHTCDAYLNITERYDIFVFVFIMPYGT